MVRGSLNAKKQESNGRTTLTLTQDGFDDLRSETFIPPRHALGAVHSQQQWDGACVPAPIPFSVALGRGPRFSGGLLLGVGDGRVGRWCVRGDGGV